MSVNIYNKAENKLNPIAGRIAPEESTEAIISDRWIPGTYNPGDLRIHNDKLWKCLVITSQEPSETSSDWELTTVTKEVGSGSSEYSTNEVVCGKWIDGKTLYRKVVEIPSIVNGSWNSTPHNIADINEICKVEAFAKYKNGIGAISTGGIGASSAASIIGFIAYADTTNAEFKTNDSGYAGSKAIVIIEYTKTTD